MTEDGKTPTVDAEPQEPTIDQSAETNTPWSVLRTLVDAATDDSFELRPT